MAGYRPQRKYIAVLAAVCALILIVGAKFKPRQVLEASISQAEMIRLQLASQRRNLENLTSYFSQVAEDVKPGLVWLRGLETSGVIWSDRGLIVAPAPTQPLQRPPLAGRYPLTPEIASIHYPVGTFRAPEEADLQALFQASASTLTQGSWILQVAARHDGGHLYAPGTFEGVIAAQCGEFRVQVVETNLPLEESTVGGGVFDLSGNLLGVILRCGSMYKPVTPESVERILEEARSFAGQLLRRYGLRVEPLTDESRKHFDTERGLLVTEVWNGWAAEAAGLRPGDIVQNLDSGEINTEEDFALLLLPVAYPTFDLSIWRNGKRSHSSMAVSSGELPDVSSEHVGIVLRSPEEGYLIDQVTPGSAAELASIQQGDRLLLVDGHRPRNLEEARKVLSGGAGRAVYVVVRRGQRIFGAYLR